MVSLHINNGRKGSAGCARPISIYLADLTYTTLSLATEAFPLNIGFIAAYCLKRFERAVTIRLFKYLDDLDQALHESSPDILGVSNYPWNMNAGMEFFRLAESLSPRTIRVMGGPNISHEAEAQDRFLIANPLCDFYALMEGETPFAGIVERALSNGLERAQLQSAPIDGVIFHRDGSIIRGAAVSRLTDLDEIPSPYLTGLMDPFFDGVLSPMIETSRGCPFSCTYCHEGNPHLSKVNFFSVERARGELDYIAAHLPPAVSNLMFADPNFGMYERDLEICEHIAAIQAKQNWPRVIFASTGKNQRDRVGAALKKLGGAMKLWMSVQSTDEAVLKEIKRDNISLAEMTGLLESFTEMGLPTFSELILGLPGETYASHITSIARLLDSGVDQVTTYSLMLLEGAELSTRASREKYGIRTHFRVLPRDFGRLSNGAVAVEVEEVVTSTATLSFEEYRRLRLFHLVVNVVCNGKPFGPLLKFLRERKIPTFALLKGLVERIESAPAAVREIVESFQHATVAELWPSREALLEHGRRPENYEKLLREEMGANLIQTHMARSMGEMEAWCEYVFRMAADTPGMTEAADRVMLDDLSSYCAGRVHNLWGRDRADDNPRQRLMHDVKRWYQAANREPLAGFRLPAPRWIEFRFTPEQIRETDRFIERFGATPTGIGRILVKTDMTRLWRDDTRFVDEVPAVRGADTRPDAARIGAN